MKNQITTLECKASELETTTTLECRPEHLVQAKIENIDCSQIATGCITSDKTTVHNIKASTFTATKELPKGIEVDNIIFNDPQISRIVPRKVRLRGFEPVTKKYRKFPEDELTMPTRNDSGSAGYDFYSNEEVKLKPGDSYLFWTDIKSYMLTNEVLLLDVRSGLGTKNDIQLKNTIGVIDSTYYGNKKTGGNIGICLKNNSNKIVTIDEGDRIAQGIFTIYFTTDDDQPLNESRNGGFGHSGK